MLALGEVSAVAIQAQAEEPEPPCWGPSQPWQLLVFCRAKGSVKGGSGGMVFPTMTSILFPQPGSAVRTQDLCTILPRNQILLGPCPEGNAERQVDGLWEEQL